MSSITQLLVQADVTGVITDGSVDVNLRYIRALWALGDSCIVATKSARSEAAGDWIQDAVKRPGRVRKYLGVAKGEKIPMRKLNGAIKRLEAKKNKTVEERSLLSALLLAKRFKSKKGV